MADKEKTEKAAQISLPLSRIKTIMKSSPDVSNISQDCLFLIAKATELFVQDLAVETLKRSREENKVDYKDLAEIVNTDDNLEFLHDIIPRKILAKEYLSQLNGGASSDDDEDVVVLD
ncbi:chromatin accessibility complex protein 1-like [Lingula anatina]|uniref:Chromatin accessibility complex protein 1 n=1 Tax=Lingula anatina TaxID=7574 RepID=A0A1S3J120_LINAN|nr:chromatin accessibility complex protein 1-like [Lingula anatina]|eukprot:XP_013404135.1 chromatin accessibility complex protein 1-like [Lingula anatina]